MAGDEILLEAIKAVRHAAAPAAEPEPAAESAPAAEPAAEPAEAAGEPAAEPAEAPAVAGEPEPAAPVAAPAPKEPAPEIPKTLAAAWDLIGERQARAEKREKDLKAREAAVQEAIGKIQQGSIETQKKDFLVELRKDPLGALAEAGVSYANLATMVLSGQARVPEVAAQKPAGPLTAEDVQRIVQETIKTQQEAQGQQSQAATYEQQYRQLIDGALAKDEYRLLSRFPEASEEIFNMAVQLSNETGKILPPETIAATLQERKREALQKLLNEDIVKTALGLKVDGPTPAASGKKAASQSAGREPETLGTEAGVTSRPEKAKPEDKLTENELLARALKAVRK